MESSLMKHKITVYNSKKPHPIYTAVVELWVDEATEDYVVTRNENEIASASTKTAALTAACDSVLRGFREPGMYTAWVDDAPYVNKEVHEVTRNKRKRVLSS